MLRLAIRCVYLYTHYIGIVAMAWENMEGYDDYPEKRLFFSFGEDIESVNDKLYEKDMVLNYNKELINT